MERATSVILDRCSELGFLLAGICAAKPSDHEHELRAWIAAGKHGEMHYLARALETLTDVRRLLPGAQSVICVADRYCPDAAAPPTRQTSAEVSADPDARGKVARYARGRDYHVHIKNRLEILAAELRAQFPADQFKVCVDASPVHEREHAVRAGIGRLGKHTLVIGNRGAGSWILLGEIVTTLRLPPWPDGSRSGEPSADGADLTFNDKNDPCGSCTRCIDACPTGALQPWSLDARTCLSYLTIEHRSEIDAPLADRMDDWIFGCDVCQEVCPHNQPTRRSRAVGWNSAYKPQLAGFDLLEVLGWDEHARRERFTGSALKRAKLAMMKRNAAIAAGNLLKDHDHHALRARLQELAHDPREDPLLRSAANHALRSADTGTGA